MKYEKALEIAKNIYFASESKDILNTLSSIFPELKESEDEKIRKDLIKSFEEFRGEIWRGHNCSHNKKDILAWLEKQGEQNKWKPSKDEMDVLYGLAYITNQYDEHKEEVITRLYQELKREFFNGSSYENMFPTNISTEDDVRRRSIIQILEYAKSLDAYNQYGKADIDKNIAWLEKQGEKKPAWSEEDEWKFSDILALLRGGENCHYNTPELFDWLKSLKQRIM